MNFTREPIIETIISPREGFKLLVRNSKGGSAEEYCVDALEVVSFGHAFFFRCLEGPKAFLVPVTDYETLEIKETRVALKNVSHERNIKIGGGREASIRGEVRSSAIDKKLELDQAEEPLSSEAVTEESSDNKRRDRRRHRSRRRPSDEEWADRSRSTSEKPAQEKERIKADGALEGGGAEDGTKVSSSAFTGLFPPPATLISENLGRYKGKEFFEGPSTSKVVEENQENLPETDSESAPLHRMAEEPVNGSVLTSTHFSPLGGEGIFF